MRITGEQLRMLRGALRLSVRDFAGIVGCGTATVVHLERGGKPHAATIEKINRAFAPYVEFVEPIEGVRGPGLILKPGFEVAVRGASQGDAAGDTSGGGLNTMAWDEESDTELTAIREEPLPPLEWSEEDKRAQIEHWRARPEKWAALAEVSRQCLLRAMGVERL
jgi:transcriptional regulator with XRE-family HTH domain